jgi:GT2 family glycosyltransferase
MSSVSVIIPVYKKLNEFTQYLQHNVQYLHDCELIIVNDDPSVHLPEALPKGIQLHLKVTWMNNSENLGFSRSVNIAASKGKGEYLLLLNSDVKLLDDSWRRVIPEFAHDGNLFAVGFAQKEKDGGIVGRNELYFKDGLFHHRGLSSNSKSEILNSNLLPTGWAEGGSALLRKSLWDELRGFDEAYSPFYWEDVDLSYRAKLRGWNVYFSPDIIVEHHHESSTVAQFGKPKIMEIAFRNQLYFTSKFARGLRRMEYLLFRYIRLPVQKMIRRSDYVTLM